MATDPVPLARLDGLATRLVRFDEASTSLSTAPVRFLLTLRGGSATSDSLMAFGTTLEERRSDMVMKRRNFMN